jgi:alkylated DNA repair protein alkB family protein 6
MAALDFAAMLKASRKSARSSASAATPAPASPLDLSPNWLPAPPSLPQLSSSIAYLPSFLPPSSAASLLASLSRHPWSALPGRRLQNHGGVPHALGTMSERLPPFLLELAGKLGGAFDGEPPDQVLANEYERGGGIGRHK